MLKLTTALTALMLLSTAALAETQTPGSHFITNWDADSNGVVSLEEATAKRSDIFTTFDAGEDGKLSAEEYDMCDEARANDQAQMKHRPGGPFVRDLRVIDRAGKTWRRGGGVPSCRTWVAPR